MNFDALSQTFVALTDATRRAILARLVRGEAPVATLAELFHLSVRAISKHISVHERAGLVSRERDAQRRRSRLKLAPLRKVDHWIDTYRQLLPNGMKAPAMLFQIPTKVGYVWWMGDQFSNSGRSDQIWLLRLLARFTGSGLGYRVNSKPELVYVRDRAAWIESIRAALEEMSPSAVLPAHGNPVTEQVVERTRCAIDAIDTKKPR